MQFTPGDETGQYRKLTLKGLACCGFRVLLLLFDLFWPFGGGGVPLKTAVEAVSEKP